MSTLTLELTEEEQVVIFEALTTQWTLLADLRRGPLENRVVERANLREAIKARSMRERLETLMDIDLRTAKREPQS